MTNDEAADKMGFAAEAYEEMYRDAGEHVGSTILDDVKDLLEIGHLIRAGDIKGAKRKAYHLDTIVREEIPESVWKWLGFE